MTAAVKAKTATDRVRGWELEEQLVKTALELVDRLAPDGAALVADKARVLRPQEPWQLIAASREVLRPALLSDASDLAGLASLGLLNAALMLQGERDREEKGRRSPIAGGGGDEE